MTLRALLTIASASALLAACNSGDDAADETAAAPVPELTSAPAPTAAPDGTALVPGVWEVGESSGQASAVFTAEGDGPGMTIACDTRSKVITLSRGAQSAAAPASFVVEAGGEVARLDMVPAADGAGMTAEIDPTLALFAAFARTDTAIAFTSEAGLKEQYPTHPGIDRVLFACM